MMVSVACKLCTPWTTGGRPARTGCNANTLTTRQRQAVTVVQPFVHLSRPSHALPAPRRGKSSKKRAAIFGFLLCGLLSHTQGVPGPTFTHAAAPLRVSHFTCRRRHRCADPPVGVVLPSTTACGLMVNCMPRPPKRCTKTGFCALVLREFWTQLLSGALI
jgi:hypothetical protein